MDNCHHGAEPVPDAATADPDRDQRPIPIAMPVRQRVGRVAKAGSYSRSS